MDENTTTGFRIGLDASESQAGASEPPKEPGKQKKTTRKAKKSRDTAMFIVFLGFLILLVAIGWLYYDINERLRTINKSGSEEVARLSQEMGSKFQTLDNQITAVKKANEKQIASLETKLEETDGRLKKLQSGITGFETTLGNLKEDLDPLKNELQQSGQKMADLRETARSIQNRQTDIESRIETNATKIQKLTDKLQTLSEARVSPDMLEKAMKEERAFYEKNTAHATEALFSEIASLKEQIRTLESDMENLRARLIHLQELPEPKKGEIVEQEIQ